MVYDDDSTKTQSTTKGEIENASRSGSAHHQKKSND
jgi:hypothetical protein